MHALHPYICCVLNKQRKENKTEALLPLLMLAISKYRKLCRKKCS